MNEKLIEKKLREGVKKLGGLALKFTSPGTAGVPDRIVLMPGGKIYFVELKTTGRKLSVRQEVMVKALRELGCNVCYIDDQGLLDFFLKFIQK